MTDEIKKEYPDHAVMGEESSEALGIKEVDCSKSKKVTTWILDPIDGTTNFVHGFPFCAVSIGVWRGGE